jgi:hypothetical protein
MGDQRRDSNLKEVKRKRLRPAKSHDQEKPVAVTGMAVTVNNCRPEKSCGKEDGYGEGKLAAARGSQLKKAMLLTGFMARKRQ